jgi:hypothetical protein
MCIYKNNAKDVDDICVRKHMRSHVAVTRTTLQQQLADAQSTLIKRMKVLRPNVGFVRFKAQYGIDMRDVGIQQCSLDNAKNEKQQAIFDIESDASPLQISPNTTFPLILFMIKILFETLFAAEEIAAAVWALEGRRRTCCRPLLRFCCGHVTAFNW